MGYYKMSKFVTKLKLANKKADVYRIVNGEYQLHLSQIPVRYEGLEPVDTALRISDNIREKVMLITSNLICDVQDILITDKIVVGDTSFVCSGIRKYDEANLSFLEMLIRQMNSPYHEDATLWVLNEDQPNYDPLFRVYTDAKNVTKIPLRALVTTEPLRKRGEYSSTELGGQNVQDNILLIVDLPTKVAVENKVFVRGNLYHVRRVEHLEYQTECLLEKVSTEGQEFIADKPIV